MFFRVFYPFFQEEDSFEQMYLLIPGSLVCFRNVIGKIFEKEKLLLYKKKRFEKIFRKVNIKPVFTSRNNLKKLIVKTKMK